MKQPLKTLSLSMAIILMVSTAGVFGQNLNRKLNGDYVFTTSLHCLTVTDPDSFDEFLRPLPAGVGVALHRNVTSVGVRTFNGDGTSSLIARVLTQRFDRTTFADGGAMSVVTIDCPAGTYEVFPDDSFTQDYGSCTGLVIEPVTGTLTVDDITAGGQIGQGGRTLLIYDTGLVTGSGPDIQTSTTTITAPIPSGPTTRLSVCGRSGSAVKR